MGWSRDTVVKVAQRTGYPVVLAWSGHNKGQMGTVLGPMLHHTGTAASAAGDYPTLRVVRDGRAGLENSLSMYGLGKSGTIYCISEKLSWHAGGGNWKGITDGNGRFAGIEAESDGRAWTPQQIDAYQRLAASILIETGRDASWAPAHREYALPAGRKPDPGNINLADFRAKVQGYINNPATLNKNGSVPAAPSFPIIGAIRACYDRTGKKVGTPKGPEVPTFDKVGRWQEFTQGAIYWHPNVDKGNAHEVRGEIFKKWRALGSELTTGYPVSDELSHGVGASSHFANGWAIYWSPKTGAWDVHGAFLNYYRSTGWEAGRLGYPLSGECKREDGLIEQKFEKGRLVLLADGTFTDAK